MLPVVFLQLSAINSTNNLHCICSCTLCLILSSDMIEFNQIFVFGILSISRFMNWNDKRFRNVRLKYNLFVVLQVYALISCCILSKISIEMWELFEIGIELFVCVCVGMDFMLPLRIKAITIVIQKQFDFLEEQTKDQFHFSHLITHEQQCQVFSKSNFMNSSGTLNVQRGVSVSVHIYYTCMCFTFTSFYILIQFLWFW